MRTLLVSGLAVLMGGALAGILATPIMANPSAAPIGFVLQVGRVHSSMDLTRSGATIYEGDSVETQADGILRARLGGSQLYLRPNTLAEVHGLSNGFSASLVRGAVIVSSSEGQSFILQVGGATIRSVGTQATVAQVTMVSASELVLTSNRGTIEVSVEGDVKMIQAGNSYRMEILAGDSGPQDNPKPGTEHGDSGDHGRRGPHPAGRHRVIWIGVGAAAAVAGVGIVLSLAVSPAKP